MEFVPFSQLPTDRRQFAVRELVYPSGPQLATTLYEVQANACVKSCGSGNGAPSRCRAVFGA